MTKTRNRTLLSNNHTKPRESHSQKATTQKTRSPATVRYGTAAAVVQLHRMQSTYAACAGAALSHKQKTLRKRTTQPKSLPPKTRRKPPEDPRANRGGRIQEDSGWAPQDFATPAVFRRVLRTLEIPLRDGVLGGRLTPGRRHGVGESNRTPRGPQKTLPAAAGAAETATRDTPCARFESARRICRASPGRRHGGVFLVYFSTRRNTSGAL